ncbi:MAG: hypothetical protein Fur0024_5350 [Patescibacteria group bacterium]
MKKTGMKFNFLKILSSCFLFVSIFLVVPKNVNACGATPVSGTFFQMNGDIDDLDCAVVMAEHVYFQLYKVALSVAIAGYVIAGYQYMIGQKEKGKKYIQNLTWAMVFATIISLIMQGLVDILKIK